MTISLARLDTYASHKILLDLLSCSNCQVSTSCMQTPPERRCMGGGVYVKLDSGLWTGLWTGLAWTGLWTDIWTELWTDAELFNDHSLSKSVSKLEQRFCCSQ